ncbi:MFS transporter [Nocardiopsis halotolerans]|uniref:MFS transporter n=1 Tax=Nocardiopsis halotolerans TaxID=124252 RepID=UPI001360B465|nr:MFS transporter [Nocardiopsis halotolerans]
MGTFVIGTDAFVVAGVLPSLTEELRVDATAVGLLITLFAVTYAVASPVLGALTSQWERRRLLLVALAVFAVANLLAAITPNYGFMLFARVLAGIGAAMFTPAATGTAAMLVSAEVRGRALALVGAGLTIATVIGVPLATLVGNTVGFRAAFWAITAASVVVAAVIAMRLPAVTMPGGTTLRQRLDIARLPGVLSTLAVSTCAFVGGFTVYNYIAPLFDDQLGADPRSITLLLLAFGVGGAIGNFVGGSVADRIGAFRTVLTGLVLASGGLLLIALVGDTWAGAVVSIMLWGVGGWMQVPAQQARLVALAGPAGPLAISLNASAMYLGIGLAGAVGGLVIGTAGLGWLAPFGASMGALGLVITLVFYPRAERRAAAAATDKA